MNIVYGYNIALIMAELDLYKLSDAVEDAPGVPEDYEPPANAKYYPPTKVTDEAIKLLPLKNLELTKPIRLALLELELAFGTKTYHSRNDTPERVNRLRLELRQLYQQFKDKRALKPIFVRTTILIEDPSPNDPTRPTLEGYGSPRVIQYPILTDYDYEIIDGQDRVALSFFFGFDHIPVLVRV